MLHAYAAKAKQYPGCKVGVFWDFMALPQRTTSTFEDRTEVQLARFRRALRGINVLYGNQRTTVLLVTTPIPEGSRNMQPYSGRGWCVTERAISGIIKDDTALINLSLLSGSEQTVEEITAAGKAHREPPMSPDAFHAQLLSGSVNGSIKFTKSGDVSLVASIYQRAFEQELGTAAALFYSELGWSDSDVHTLAVSLKEAFTKGLLKNMQKLDLESNQVSDIGVTELVRNCSKGVMHQLTSLDLNENRIGDDGARALASACSEGALTCCTELYLNGNLISDAGLESLIPHFNLGLRQLQCFGIATLITDSGAHRLAEVLTGGLFINLSFLTLASNQVGDDGVVALADASRKGGLMQLEELYLYNNRIGDDGFSALIESSSLGCLPKLEELYIYRNVIGDRGFQVFADAYATGSINHLKSVHLNDNTIGDVSILYFTDRITRFAGKSANLCELFLGDNSITEPVMQELSRAARGASIKLTSATTREDLVATYTRTSSRQMSNAGPEQVLVGGNKSRRPTRHESRASLLGLAV